MSARTILNPPLINELNGLFNGTTPINVASVDVGVQPDNVLLTCPSAGTLEVDGVITTTELALTGNGSTSTPYLNTNAGNGLVVSTLSGTGITLSTPAGGVGFFASASDTLQVSGTLNVATLNATTSITSGGDITSSGNITTTAGSFIGIYCKVTGFVDSTNSSGTAGQVITANGAGGWSWA